MCTEPLIFHKVSYFGDFFLWWFWLLCISIESHWLMNESHSSKHGVGVDLRKLITTGSNVASFSFTNTWVRLLYCHHSLATKKKSLKWQNDKKKTQHSVYFSQTWSSVLKKQAKVSVASFSFLKCLLLLFSACEIKGQQPTQHTMTLYWLPVWLNAGTSPSSAHLITQKRESFTTDSALLTSDTSSEWMSTQLRSVSDLVFVLIKAQFKQMNDKKELQQQQSRNIISPESS